MTPYMVPDIHPDPVRIRCGNCGQPFEEHEALHCACCDQDFRLCTNGDECDRHMRDAVYRPESDEDRQADWAGAHGL